MIKIMKYSEVAPAEIFARTIPQDTVADKVTAIIEAVKEKGDAALFDFCERFDGAKLESLRVSEEELAAAIDAVEPEFLAVLHKAADNIRAFHEKQLRDGFQIERGGAILGQKVMPIEKVGLCVPGGKTPLSSTVLMDAIPAKVAGCGELVMVTPARPDGTIDASILAAANIAGVDKIFKLGGAQAVAALAYGTQSVPRVDKIVGPGGAFVAEAKKQVFGRVAIDMIAGPSEILVIADGKTDPRYAAADLLSQAEHDVMASAVLVTDSEELAQAVSAEIEVQLPQLARAEIARKSIDNHGKIIVAENIDLVIDIVNEIAPEHLELCVDEPFAYLERIRHAGSVFLGRHCPEALGDYLAGTNHTLPTSGTARFSSPLSVDDFVKKTQYIYYTEDALSAVARDVDRFARKEGLTGHARSAMIRMEEAK
ncbi:MAG: histidinol dehydrogenase [Clostridia bacterium]|nr:histidinol dehydrogenase [Clostridia bacterium]